jgi:uncharacterized protein
MSEALQALYAGDETRARELLGSDSELTVFEAAAFGRADRLREILAADPAQARAFAEDGFTALHLAVFSRDEEAARALLEAGADPDALATAEIAQVRPLGTAAFVGSVPLARVLLDGGADVNAQGEGGFTALHSAAQHGDEELARFLLERGADPGITSHDGRRPADLGLADVLS